MKQNKPRSTEKKTAVATLNCTQLQSDCMHNTPHHIHYDANFPENFNAQERSHRS